MFNSWSAPSSLVHKMPKLNAAKVGIPSSPVDFVVLKTVQGIYDILSCWWIYNCAVSSAFSEWPKEQDSTFLFKQQVKMFSPLSKTWSFLTSRWPDRALDVLACRLVETLFRSVDVLMHSLTQHFSLLVTCRVHFV